MADDVIWIVTDETPESEAKKVDGERDGSYTGNRYDTVDSQPVRSQQQRRIPVSVDKLEQGMADFVGAVGRVLSQTKQSTADVMGMELEEIELMVEVNGEGQLSLLGSGGKAGAKGAMTLKFKAKKAP
jgi:hypothetical protein